MADTRDLAGRPAAEGPLVDVAALEGAYHETGDFSLPSRRVAFGTSGHRGSSLDGSFNDAHVRAITSAICDYREKEGIDGPLFLGWDTHALSRLAFTTALEVFGNRQVRVLIDSGDRPTPTPALSRAILVHNRSEKTTADGVVLTPSHNPPEDGGYKYNPPSGGPADTAVTRWIEQRANEVLGDGSVSTVAPSHSSAGEPFDYCGKYVADLPSMIDVEVIARAGLRIAVDPMGGASLPYWSHIQASYGLGLEVVNPGLDPTFRFMNRDWDGKIRMDCSSPYAMSSLVGKARGYDLGFGNDADADRHGIVSGSSGLMPPNHFLVAAADYLFGRRQNWHPGANLGRTVVTTALLDRVADMHSRTTFETPVGFKWFVDGLLSGALAFAGEESAGATFLRADGEPWTTDKDGIVMCLLAAEMCATAGRRPDEIYADIDRSIGPSFYSRVDRPATAEDKQRLAEFNPTITQFAGAPVLAVLRDAPGNGAAIGGVKIETDTGWVAARPSGTEQIYKLYAESFVSESHLHQMLDEADSLLTNT